MKEVSAFLVENALTVGTRNAYNRAKSVYSEFHESYFPDIALFPLTVEKIVLFISYCYKKQLAPQTVTTYISALSHFNKMENHEDPTQNFVVKRALQGFQKLKGKHDTRLPITPSVLNRLVNSLSQCTASYYQRCLFKAMFLLAFHAFLRVGEITSTGKNVIDISAVNFTDCVNEIPQGMSLTLTDFKHHNGKPPVTFQMQANHSNKDLCVVTAMWEYLQVRGSDQGPLFMYQDKTPISRHTFNQQLKISLNFCEYDTTCYKGHSFRIGAATWAKSKGIADDKIQLFGRWKSDAYRKYIRIPLMNI